MYQLTADLLFNLSLVPRFTVVGMFLSPSEKKGLCFSFFIIIIGNIVVICKSTVIFIFINYYYYSYCYYCYCCFVVIVASLASPM